MAWQVFINIFVPRKLLRQGDASLVMQACVSVVDADHNGFALEIVSNLIRTIIRHAHRVFLKVPPSCRLPL